MAVNTPAKYGFDQMSENPALELRLRKLERELATRSDTNLGSTETRIISGEEVPAAITGLVLVSAIQTIRIKWNASQINNLKEYEVQVDTDTNFPDPDIFRTTLLNYDYTGGSAATTYYVRVAAISTAGQTGGWSGTLNTTTGQVVEGDLADSSVATPKIVIEAAQAIVTLDQSGTNDMTVADQWYEAVQITVVKVRDESDVLLTGSIVFDYNGGGASNGNVAMRLTRDDTDVLVTYGDSARGIHIKEDRELSQAIVFVDAGDTPLIAGTYTYEFDTMATDNTDVIAKLGTLTGQEVKR